MPATSPGSHTAPGLRHFPGQKGATMTTRAHIFSDLETALAETTEAATHAEHAYENARTITARQTIAAYMQNLERQRRALAQELGR